MTVYWIVWVIIIFNCILIHQSDYITTNEITEGRAYHSKSARFFFIASVVILILVAGLRYYVGTDYGGYYKGFFEISNNIKDALLSLNEPGIKVVYKIASFFSDSLIAGIFFAAFVTIGIQLIVIYRNTDRIDQALVLFTFMCWSACFNGVKQALATAVLFAGFSSLKNRKFLKFTIAVFLAFLFHKSAIIMVLMYFVSNRKVNKKNIVLLIIASTVVLLSYDYVYQIVNALNGGNITGTEEYWSTQVGVFRVLTKVVPAIFFLWVYRNKNRSESTDFYLNILMIHAVVAVTTSNSACLARMSMYTSPFAVLSIVELLKGLETRNQRTFFCVIAILYWFVSWYEFSIHPDLNNFRFIWQI